MVLSMIITALSSWLFVVMLEFVTKRGGLAFAFALISLKLPGQLFNFLHERIVDRMRLLKQGPGGRIGSGDFRNFHESEIVVNSSGNREQ